MAGDHERLTMRRYLEAVAASEDMGQHAALVSQGFHPNVVDAKAEKAARRGYIEYGTSSRYGWLTDKGRAFLAPR